MSEQDQVAGQIGEPVDADLLKAVEILATRQGRRLNVLIDEALRDFLQKYRHQLRVLRPPQEKENPTEGNGVG